MKGLQSIDYLVFAAYFAALVGVALWVARRPTGEARGAEDYFLAGRSLPWWIIGASLIASNISTEQIIGMNGTAFESGIAVVSYSLIGAAVTILIVGKWFLPRFLAGRIYSMPEFLERRYDRRVSTVMSLFWILVYVLVNLTTVLSLGAITLEAVLGVPLGYGVAGLALVSGIYTIYGGLAAVAWTDFVQVTVLVLGGAAVVWLGLDAVAVKYGAAGPWAGGVALLDNQADKFHTVLPAGHPELPWTGVFLGGLWIAALSYWGCNQYIIQRALAARSLREAQRGLLFAALLSVVWLGLDAVAVKYGAAGPWAGGVALLDNQADKFHTVLPAGHPELPWTGVFLGGLWIAALSYWGCNQYIIQRALAARSLREAQRGLLFAALLSVVVAVIIVLPGVIASELFADRIGGRDEAFPVLIRELLPAGYAGLVIAALVAAIVSSLNSMCNSVATIFTMDVYKVYLRPAAGDRATVRTGRITTAVALLVAAAITPFIASLGSLFAFIQEYTGFVTPGVLCIFLLGMFWPRMTARAALAVVLLTVPLSLGLKHFVPELAFLNRMAVTFLLLCALAAGISHFTAPAARPTPAPAHRSAATPLYDACALALTSLIAIFYLTFP